MDSYTVRVTLQGSVEYYRGGGPEQKHIVAPATQDVIIFMDASSAEEAEDYAMKIDYEHHPDCELMEGCGIIGCTAKKYGEAENLPPEIEFKTYIEDC